MRLPAAYAWLTLCGAWQWGGAQSAPVNHVHPIWSPDGKAIFFESDRSGNSDIYRLELATGEWKRLTDHPSMDSAPIWRDGAILFRSDRNGRMEWFTMAPDGSGQRPLGHDVTDESRRADGAVVFAGTHQGERGVFLRTAGTGVRRLASHAHASQPDFAPDGSAIVFEVRESPPDGGYMGAVYLMGADGSSPRRLHEGTDPSWSPDGQWILFKSHDERGDLRVSLIRPDGSGLRILHRGAHMSFSPDGARILFMAEAGGAYDIWTMKADGSAVKCETCAPPERGRRQP